MQLRQSLQPLFPWNLQKHICLMLRIYMLDMLHENTNRDFATCTIDFICVWSTEGRECTTRDRMLPSVDDGEREERNIEVWFVCSKGANSWGKKEDKNTQLFCHLEPSNPDFQHVLIKFCAQRDHSFHDICLAYFGVRGHYPLAIHDGMGIRFHGCSLL